MFSLQDRGPNMFNETNVFWISTPSLTTTHLLHLLTIGLVFLFMRLFLTPREHPPLSSHGECEITYVVA